MTNASNTSSTPVWALAHGGPNSLYDTTHAAHKFWKSTLVDDIRAAQPKGIVVVSAHWQANPPHALQAVASDGDKHVEINVDPTNPLIFDFYGFPKHYYDATFTTHNPAWLHTQVAKHLQQRGYSVHQTERGLDHGVWVPLKSAFGDKMDIPLVQVSLPVESGNASKDIEAALRLGHALRSLRDEGLLVIGSGQPVHNLRDLGVYGWDSVRPYSASFSEALKKAMADGVTDGQDKRGDSDDVSRWSSAKELAKRQDFKGAHPTSEHLLPLLVSLGAAHDNEAGIRKFDFRQASLVWDMYRFGGVAQTA